MLYFGQIEVWGILLVIVLLGAAFAILWIVDKRIIRKAMHLSVHLPRVPQSLWLPLFGAMLLSALALTGCMTLSLSCHAFWPMFIILLLSLCGSTPHAFEVYLRSLKHTKAHRRYLMANGATHLESIVPSVRRSLRAAFLPMLWQRSSAMPLAMLALFCTLWLCGATITAALVITLMTWAAAIAAAVLAIVLTMWLADRQLFDKQENVKPASTEPTGTA